MLESSLDKILNIIYKIVESINTNNENKNTAAIDLIDTASKIIMQISATSTTKK